MLADGRLPPVLPIVLYNGNRRIRADSAGAWIGGAIQTKDEIFADRRTRACRQRTGFTEEPGSGGVPAGTSRQPGKHAGIAAAGTLVGGPTRPEQNDGEVDTRHIDAQTQGTADPFLHEPRCGSNREDRDAYGAGRSRDYDAKPCKEASTRFGRNPHGTGLGGRTAALRLLSRRITLDCEPRLAFHPARPPSRSWRNRSAVPYHILLPQMDDLQEINVMLADRLEEWAHQYEADGM